MGEERVKQYFDDIAVEFDSIYENDGGIVSKFLNGVFRVGMYERFAQTIEELGDVRRKSILDVGCGSGRLTLALAEKGAEVIGIDYSLEMINLANRYRSKHKDIDARFLCCDFITEYLIDRTFDITVALGVSDYIADSIPLLRKMLEVTRDQMIVSYPAKFCLQMPIRKAWLLTRNCPVYFYSIKRLAEIYKTIGVGNYEIIRLPVGTRMPTDYLVKAVL